MPYPEKKFQTLVEVTTDWIWEVDARGVYVYSSPNGIDLLGFAPEEVVGKTPFDLMPPDEAERMRAVFQELARARLPLVNLENVNLHKDGRRVTIETNGIPIFDAAGNYCGYRGIDRNISDRKAIEEKLRESELLYRTLFRNAPVGIGVSDLNGRIIDSNDAMIRIMGYDREDLSSISLPQTYRDPSRRGEFLAILFRDGRVEDIELDLLKKDGSAYLGVVTASLLQINGRSLILTALDDITARRRAEISEQKLMIELETARRELEKHLLEKLELAPGRPATSIHPAGTEADVEMFEGTGRMRGVMELARIAASSSEPALVFGETGTGKGLLAAWIHRRSSRAGRNLVALNCSSFKGELFGSELFGHARGAFTSAVSDHRGLIEEADGGTLFLDEIADMDLKAQSQLLKVLEEKQFRRVGETRLRRSNFRLVCASNRNLAEEVESGRFRSDLYYRINVLPIPLPPLRERLEDLPELVEYLLAGLQVDRRLSADTLHFLSSYSWPGNVRELRNALIRAALLSSEGPILPEHFAEISQPSRKNAPTVLPATLKFSEREEIVKALRTFHGNRSKAAHALGISRSTLYRKMQDYGIDPFQVRTERPRIASE